MRISLITCIKTEEPDAKMQIWAHFVVAEKLVMTAFQLLTKFQLASIMSFSERIADLIVQEAVTNSIWKLALKQLKPWAAWASSQGPDTTGELT